MRLRGKAADTYTRLSDDDAADYDILTTALLERYQRGPDFYRHRFRAARKEGPETFVQFLGRMEGLLSNWARQKGKDVSVAEQVWDLFLEEQLMDTMTNDP